MSDFADLMNAMARVVIAAQEWKASEGTNDRFTTGHLLYAELEHLERLDTERLDAMAAATPSAGCDHEFTDMEGYCITTEGCDGFREPPSDDGPGEEQIVSEPSDGVCIDHGVYTGICPECNPGEAVDDVSEDAWDAGYRKGYARGVSDASRTSAGDAAPEDVTALHIAARKVVNLWAKAIPVDGPTAKALREAVEQYEAYPSQGEADRG